MAEPACRRSLSRPSTRQGGGRIFFFAMPLNCTKNAIFDWKFLLFLSSPRTYPNGKHIAIATTPRYPRNHHHRYTLPIPINKEKGNRPLFITRIQIKHPRPQTAWARELRVMGPRADSSAQSLKPFYAVGLSPPPRAEMLFTTLLIIDCNSRPRELLFPFSNGKSIHFS